MLAVIKMLCVQGPFFSLQMGTLEKVSMEKREWEKGVEQITLAGYNVFKPSVLKDKARLDGVVVSIPDCQSGDPGPNPGRGVYDRISSALDTS